jgi:hypothetical protein
LMPKLGICTWPLEQWITDTPVFNVSLLLITGCI